MCTFAQRCTFTRAGSHSRIVGKHSTRVGRDYGRSVSGPWRVTAPPGRDAGSVTGPRRARPPALPPWPSSRRLRRGALPWTLATRRLPTRSCARGSARSWTTWRRSSRSAGPRTIGATSARPPGPNGTPGCTPPDPFERQPGLPRGSRPPERGSRLPARAPPADPPPRRRAPRGPHRREQVRRASPASPRTNVRKNDSGRPASRRTAAPSAPRRRAAPSSCPARRAWARCRRRCATATI